MDSLQNRPPLKKEIISKMLRAFLIEWMNMTVRGMDGMEDFKRLLDMS